MQLEPFINRQVSTRRIAAAMSRTQVGQGVITARASWNQMISCCRAASTAQMANVAVPRQGGRRKGPGPIATPPPGTHDADPPATTTPARSSR